MKFSFKKIALIGKHNAPQISKPLLELADFLHAQGLEVMFDSLSAIHLEQTNYPVLSLQKIAEQADVAIVMGGDGTMLNIARTLAPFGVPLIGVNQGRLGFLTDLPLENVQQSLLKILSGKYIADQRLLLTGNVFSKGELVFQGIALNEVLLHRCNIGSLIEFEVRVDGDYLYTQRGDGLIITTPTGSTAYAMSAGGAILHPSLETLQLVPICPHTLSNRPIVIDGSSTLEILTFQPGGARVRFDGHISCDLAENDKITLVPHIARACLLHPEDYSFYHTLREKLHWNHSY